MCQVPDTVFVKRDLGGDQPVIDTLYIRGGVAGPQVLVGTQFLPYSDRIIGLMNNCLFPETLEIIEECDENTDPRTFKDYPKFKAIIYNSETLSVDVSIVANCCHNFLGEAEVIGGDTLNLVYTPYGSFCGCDCCFTLRYTFSLLGNPACPIIKYVSINGSKVLGLVPKQD